ncbi:BREX-1 system adenine-specific DNA-methyltransferase PglX [Streptococcus parasuis]|uniref:BREX-1 system adenine-specific DNA-methyltransferase PglX n=1 Tax=Streptococcus parasuis TaxID=1501662 RepID=UPI0028AE878E|nr:BREX-1 system adenine-specific DNA-methyltransferase PglX [Streptococcus parasuis]
MNKNAIQKYAIWARNELIEQVKQRAFQYGIDEKGYGDENASVIAGRVLSTDEKRQRRLFVDEIKKSGYNQAVEEVAYTWFNRIIALRYMEVNDFLPTHIRVFSDTRGNFNPEILTNVLHLDLPGLDKAKVSEYLNGNKTEELYRYLLLTQCNALNDALPEMFEKLGGYTEMLLPNNILKQDSVLARLVKDIDENDWKDSVEIIGWMYQYYISEKHDQVVDILRGKAVKKEDIPAATQLFTTDWIVRYMVENSLGRLWLESHPNGSLKAKWKYYIDDAKQKPEVAECLRILRLQLSVKSPEDIRIIDPCMGSGHILVYAFDVLMQIYESEGYNPRDAAKLILKKNIYGLDIDLRAYQLAYFSLMMKARQYNRRIFTDSVKPQVYYPTGFPDGEEYGSLVKVDALPPKPEEPKEITLFTENYEATLNAWNFKRLLSQKYDVVITNPPYLSKINDKLKDFINSEYKDYNGDLFSVFIYRNLLLCKTGGFSSYMTPNVWMFIKSYEKLRSFIIENKSVSSLIQLAKGAFYKEATVDVCAFVLRNEKQLGNAVFVRLEDFKADMEVQQKKLLEVITKNDKHIYEKDPMLFLDIEGNPFAYWISEQTRKTFKSPDTIGTLAPPKQGLATADNNRFLRLWYEVCINSIGFGYGSTDDAAKSGKKWFPYNKGGAYRRWYGNREYVVNWENDGAEIKSFKDDGGKLRSRPQNLQYIFRQSITWSDTTSASFSGRFCEKGFIFDIKGSSGFPNDDSIKYVLGLLNSGVSQEFIRILNPTITTQVGDMARIPIVMNEHKRPVIEETVSENIQLSRDDWDAYETSWDFKRHPLLCSERTIAEAFVKWKREAEERFNTLKVNEEELNRIFIDIYGLHDELTPDVEDKDVTVRRADLGRDIRSFISYSVGCMFGRYSLDVEGLAYAGGTWDSEKYKTFPADEDNILPICDDEYFDDDISGRFVDFVKAVYGADSLEENLKFIADALGGKGTPREVIRNYFLNDFYKDHVKIYQKRPVYWLFDSGKKNGFKALIYMHRYSRDLLAKLRTDYVHEQQERYRTQLSHIASALNTASGADRAKLLKQQDKLTEQLREITEFEEKVHHLADQNIMIDLDNGVKKNYKIFADVLAKI